MKKETIEAGNEILKKISTINHQINDLESTVKIIEGWDCEDGKLRLFLDLRYSPMIRKESILIVISEDREGLEKQLEGLKKELEDLKD